VWLDAETEQQVEEEGTDEGQQPPDDLSGTLRVLLEQCFVTAFFFGRLTHVIPRRVISSGYLASTVVSQYLIPII
jgi:hypothetical protein